MHSYTPVFLLALGCGSSGTLDQPNPVPTWYIEEPNEDTPKTVIPDDTPPPDAPNEAGTAYDRSNNAVDAVPTASSDVRKKSESKSKTVGDSQ